MSSAVQVPRDSSHKLMTSRAFLRGLGVYLKFTCIDECVDLPNILEFINDDGVKVAQKFLENTEEPIGLYKKAHELTSEFKEFGDFIGNFDYLEMEYSEPYNHSINVYKNLKNEEFIHRKDLFPLIQSIVLHYVPDMRYDITISVLSVFLRMKEKKMGGGYMEFIKYSDDLLHGFSEVLNSNEFKQKLNNAPQKGKQIIALNKSDALSIWYEFSDIELLFDSPDSMTGLYCLDVYWKWQVTMEAIETFISSREDLFSSKKRYRTVRLFEDGTERFVFTNELAIALDKKYNKDNDLKIMIVQDRFLERLPQIDFICIPFTRSKRRAIPIMTPNEEHAILASDSLIELLNQLIDFEHFQSATPETLKLALNEIESEFCSNGKQKTFVDFFTHDTLLESASYIMTEDAITLNKIKRSDVSNGFTEQSVLEVIKRLTLDTVFPNILKYVNMAYKYVNDNKDTDTLMISDFFKCLKICQMMCIMEMSPKLKKYLHEQKACNNLIGIECKECPKISRRSFTGRSVTIENLVIKEEQVMADDHEDNDEPENEARVEKNKKTKAKKQSSVDKTTSSDAHKQSNNCLKCFRTSERCNQVKEKLKQEKTKVKQLIEIQKENEKKMSQMEELRKKQNEEKDAKIQELMAQLAALQSCQQPETPETSEVPVETPKRTELSQEMKDILFEFITKRNTILNDNPVPEVSTKAYKLKARATEKNDKMGAQMEYREYCNNYTQYMNALEVNINRIQSNVNIISSDLLEIPEFPSLSSGFLEAYERVVTVPEKEKAAAVAAAKKKKEEEEERDNECQICYNDMKPSEEETLKCPHCPKTYHSSCISEWINKSPTCPNCRGKFLNPVEYPPLC